MTTMRQHLYCLSAIRWLETRAARVLGWMFVFAVLGTAHAEAQTYTVLYNFAGGVDGKNPEAGLILDSAGNLYGTTYKGGASGLGAVFKVDTTGKETVLYSFTGGADGAWPYAGLTSDSAGNLYGTTAAGGVTHNSCSQPGVPRGCGVVFKLDVTGKEAVLHRFTGVDGANPYAGLVLDSAGSLYGTTVNGGGGGTPGVCNSTLAGCGVVFKLDKTGKETVLYAFTGGADGGIPEGGLIRDSAGYLYGTTSFGGVSGTNGVVFKLDTTGKETVLYSFTGGADGGVPEGGVIQDSEGTLYGTTYGGGIGTCPFSGCGVVFKLDMSGKETVLYSFTGGADGAMPDARLILDSAGNLYGTTYQGGYQGGVVFKLDSTGKETVLHRFTRAGGIYPQSLVSDSAGHLYGTTTSGGIAYGTVFKLKP